MAPSQRIRRHLQSNAIAYVALFVALSGTAIALPGKNKVKKNDIARGAVVGKAIASSGEASSGHISAGLVSKSAIGSLARRKTASGIAGLKIQPE